MPRPDSSRIKEIFSAVVELEPDARGPYLDRVCEADARLRDEVETLLIAHEQPGGIVDASSVGEFLLADRPETRTLANGEQVGRFRIVRLIGKGGMGEVYEADDPSYCRRVALKILRPEFLTRSDFAARFRREIRVAWTVTHPNVCRVFDVGECETHGTTTAFLTMELLVGETLAERLARGAVPPNEAVPFIRHILQGIVALHDAKVVHRDLKPANVIIVGEAEGQRCVITDFGLAHNRAAEAVTEGITAAGQVLGTPAYMAPEQLTGKEVGPESDIYALGIVMYEILSGRRPFDGNNFVESATQKMLRPPRPPSKFADLDTRWDSLILDCLQAVPGKRPQTARQVLVRLNEIDAHRPRWGFGVRHNRLRRSLRAHKPAVYVTFLAASVGALAIPLSLPAVRIPALRRLCRQLPGQATLCMLPGQRDAAVLPFAIRGRTDADRALATGLARYVRQSFARLSPHPESVCVHLRNDRLTDGMSLVVEGEVEATPDSVAVNLVVREAGVEPGGRAPLTLRTVSLKVPKRHATQLHSEPVLQLAKALEVQLAGGEWGKWLKAAPRESDSFLGYLRGLGYLETGRYDEAALTFSATLESVKDFGFAPAHVGLGDAYRLKLNRTGEQSWAIRARQAYQRAVSLESDAGFAGAEKSWGRLEAGLGNTAEAIRRLDTALRMWPYDDALRKDIAAAYESSGQLERSEQTLVEAVRVMPHCWLSHNTLAYFYSRHARFSESEKELLDVVRLPPGNGNAYHNLAVIYIGAGRFDDAIEMASRAIQLSQIPLAYSTLGRAFLYRGCPASALVNLTRAVELQPEYFMLWSELAEGLEAMEKHSARADQAAVRVLEVAGKTLEDNPANALARAEYALNAARLGRKQIALENADRAMAQASGSHDVILLVIATLESLGQRDAALQKLEEALRSGLSLHEVQARYSLTGLRQEPGYGQLLKRLRLNPAADPGGLTPVRGKCPDSPRAGAGLSAP